MRRNAALARDAIPDLSDPQLVLVAEWMGHSAPEVAAQVTEVLTGALEGVPGSTTVRGSSMADMAYVDVVFKSDAALPAGRAEIVRRVDALRRRLPAAVHIQVGPEASATGWVLQYALVRRRGSRRCRWARRNIAARAAELRPLREFQEKVLRPALVGIPGVAEVARWAATEKRWSSRPPTPSCGPRAPPFRTSRPRCARGSTGRPGRPGRTTSRTIRRCAS